MGINSCQKPYVLFQYKNLQFNNLYKSFLQASSVRYSGKALSEVSPVALSHDSASRWLNSQNFRPGEIYKEVSKYIDQNSPCLLVGDDTLISNFRFIHLMMK